MPANLDGAHKAIATVWRMESARLIGGLMRLTRDLDGAEDLAQEALIAALEQWPAAGIPKNPGAWLMTAAKNRALDQFRHDKMVERKHGTLGDDYEGIAPAAPASPDAGLDADQVGDDLLRLILVSCHPVISREARVALTLRLVGGLTTEEIAHAFLSSEATIAQRIVRAKRTLAEARVPFEVPEGDELTQRLASVLEVIYLIFNEGYYASRGEAWIRQDLCDDALRMGRILSRLVSDEPETWGLVGLLELQASRTRARVGKHNEPVLLLEQDRSQWDQLLIRRGLAALERAESLKQPLGPYTLQAAIAACHARARKAGDTDWERIVAYYDALVELTQSPIVALNRAVAVGMAFGAKAGLEAVDEIADEPVLKRYHLLPSVRGDLLQKLGRFSEARAEFERAASQTQSSRERDFLLRRAASCR